MALVCAGIDEAGYGPLLGPLCVAVSAFVMDDHPGRMPDLYRVLADAVTAKKDRSDRRIVIADSKKLKGSSKAAHPLAHLERGVLCFAGAAAASPGSRPANDAAVTGSAERDAPSRPVLPGTCRALLSQLGADLPELPWYAGESPLPRDHDAGLLAIDAAKLLAACRSAGVHAVRLACHAMDARAFNERVARSGSKAEAVMSTVMRQVDALRKAFPGDDLRVVVDRQSGRRNYLKELGYAFPDLTVRILREDDEQSAYELLGGPSRLRIAFRTQAEDHHLPVALASMTAKFVRELALLRFNAFFAARKPGLRPTAGYVEDGRRFLADIEPVLTTLKVPRDTLVRSR